MLEQVHEIRRANGRYKLGRLKHVIGGSQSWKRGHSQNVCVAVTVQLKLYEPDICEAAQFEELVPFPVDLVVKAAEREREVLVGDDFGVVDVKMAHFGRPLAFVEAGEEPKGFNVWSKADVEGYTTAGGGTSWLP